MGVIESFEDRCRGRGVTLAFPEGDDQRIVEAASVLAERNLALPMVIGDPAVIRSVADDRSLALDGVEVVDPMDDDRRETYADAYGDVRGVSEDTARKMVGNELFFAALAVRTGDADGMVGGCVRTSGELIATGEEVIGLAPDVSVPSSCFVMELPDGDVLFFTDAALNENPTPAELADIAVTTGQSAVNLMGWESRVAMLSFSTKGSADHPDVDKVREATAFATERVADTADLAVDGELQADAALDEGVARRKLDDVGPVAGQANVLVFPDLDAGNIGYKLTQRLAGAGAYGPVLQGFAAPISDLSRGATVDDIVGASAITATLAVGSKTS